MSLQHALLTSLVEKPCSGYELARRFDKSIGYFWHATHQQIYRELARMDEQELQTYREIEQRDFSAVTLSRESQVHYLILKAGIAFEESRVQWTKEAIAMLRDDENTSLDDADIQP